MVSPAPMIDVCTPRRIVSGLPCASTPRRPTTRSPTAIVSQSSRRMPFIAPSPAAPSTSASGGGLPDSRRRPQSLSTSCAMKTPSTSTSSRNMRLLGHHPLNGFGNCGEGLALQKTRDGRRVLWIAHESQPKNVTALDVTNPKKPVLIAQTDLPHEKMRSNSLDLVGDLLVVAYQTSAVGLKPAGFEIFDVADPAKPKSVVFFDAAGPASRGVHHLWWVDGEYVHIALGASAFKPRHPRALQFH